MARVLGTIALNESSVNFLRGDGAWATPGGGAGAPSDAQYVTLALDATLTNERTLAGESTVVSITDGGAGSTVTVGIEAAGVANAKLANMAQNTIKGRISAGAGDPEDLTAANVRTIINVADGANNYSHPNHSGDVTSSGDGATTIANDAVTYAKMQNVSATDRVLGRQTAGSGDVEEITCTSAGRALLDDASASAQRDTLAVDWLKGITVESPTTSEDISIFFTEVAITVQKMVAVVRGTTPSSTWTVRHSTDRSAAGNEVVTGGTATTSESTGSVVTAFDDATIPANSFVWLETTAGSGTVDELHVSIVYRKD